MATAPDAPLAPRPPDPIDTELEAPPSARGVVVAEGTLTAAELAGHNLACWCRPGTPCHADMLIQLANS